MQAMKAIGVIGAGAMGIGIAQAAALSNVRVFLFDAERHKAHAQLQSLKQRLSSPSQTKQLAQLENISVVASLAELHNVYLVIEAVKECFESKSVLFKSLSQIVSADECIVASNTSSLSINKLAESYQNARNFVGLHFMNPAHKMKLVELIPNVQTSAETLEKCEQFLKALGKLPIRVADTPGFVVNRILIPYINEAIWALHDGIASKQDIDAALVHGASMPMGPLRLADFIGLDVCLAAIENLQSVRCIKCPLLEIMVRENKLGRKTKEGFYKYE